MFFRSLFRRMCQRRTQSYFTLLPNGQRFFKIFLNSVHYQLNLAVKNLATGIPDYSNLPPRKSAAMVK
ncbi:hypothetical protein HMPREF9450_01306 [Alistipes indistinctus YIT 12060]|uniref:Uncharacterized protein n=1 Tax=Alistipes indistinctus YIT 12060 TaxID=742725 RepID=G5H8P6_9BACT|nr:hypothetical protein HMPREF9450_01306 [Alistipes indistinctus YIT 12060]